ncbi:hypothetical protein T484DRAFT_1770679 [Baffinella frigidus]|nr:hypothetical protein T484DRAFT_1770679 [Cryptophyta sp. CCMP2293]
MALGKGPIAEGLDFVATQVGQSGACTAGNALQGGNAIHITLQADSKFYNERSATASGNSNLQTFLTVDQVVPTSSTDGTFRVVERSRVFSDFAFLADNLFNGATLDSVFVDNAVAAGFAVGDRVRINNEIFLITGIAGNGCPRSSFVHVGCWHTLTVRRKQHGTLAAVHFYGALVYRVVVGAVQDDQTLNEGVGIGNEKVYMNMDSVVGFEASTSIDDERFCQIEEEVAIINRILDVASTIQTIVGTTITFASSFSDVNNFYKEADIVMSSGGASGQRRKITGYVGADRAASFVAAFSGAVAGDAFYLRALHVQRGKKSTGDTEMVGNEAVTFGETHLRFSQVYFTNNTWTILKDTGTWTKSSGSLALSIIADGDPFQTFMFSFAIRNPSAVHGQVLSERAARACRVRVVSSSGATFRASSSGVNIPHKELDLDPYLAIWPVAEPLVVCFPGTWMDPGDVTCTDCTVGKFSEFCGGLYNCTACPETTYSAASRQTTCLECEEGFFCVGDSNQQPCPPGTFSDPGQSACTNCTPGFYCPGNQNRIQCPTGTHMPTYSASLCDNCQPGEFQALKEATHCNECGDGTISAVEKATACSQCLPGTWAVGDAQTECTDCPVDEYQPGTGKTSCTACPANSGAQLRMGACTGACGGSSTKSDCLCMPGFTRFGVTSDVCIAFRFNFAKVGQSSACKGRLNTIGVTMSANTALTTGVQSVDILQGGANYAAATINVVEASGIEFRGLAGVTGGVISSVLIQNAGRYFRGNPESVPIFFAAGCADSDTACSSTLQEGTIAAVSITSPGVGYAGGTLRFTGGGGSGCEATFMTDATGAVASVSFATAAAHGAGYVGATGIEVLYTGTTRCDASGASGALSDACLQRETITSLKRLSGTIRDCDTTVQILTDPGSGGGGSGFVAKV